MFVQRITFLAIFFISISTMMSYGQDHITQAEFADKLHTKGICSGKNYQKLLGDLQSRAIADPLEFLNYCDRAVIINLENYPVKPEDYLEQIHKDVAKLLPELTFTNFKFYVVLDSAISIDDSRHYRFAISLKSNGKTYKQKSYYRLFSVSENKYYGGKIDQQEFYKIFNKILADMQSPYRLHEVKAFRQYIVDWNRFGVIALTKEQAHSLHRGGVLFTPGYENFKNTLTSKRIETAISDYSRVGLFSHLSDDQIKMATEKYSQQENRNLNDVLQCFPNIIYHFDTELANLENPYEEILKELMRISKGIFKPNGITDDFSKPVNKKALIKFSINGKAYSKKLNVENDWIDPSFFDLIKQAVSDNKLNGQFYELYTGGQDASFIFLTSDQAQYTRTNKLLIFADQWQEEED